MLKQIPKGSKMLQNTSNYSKMLKNGQKCPQNGQNSSKKVQYDIQILKNALKCSKTLPNAPKISPKLKCHQN